MTPVGVSAAVTGLLPNATYHFRVCATNVSATNCGSDLTFTTLNVAYETSLTAYENPQAMIGQPNAVAIDPTTEDYWVAESSLRPSARSSARNTSTSGSSAKRA